MKISKKIILILVAMFLSLNFHYKVIEAVNVKKRAWRSTMDT